MVDEDDDEVEMVDDDDEDEVEMVDDENKNQLNKVVPNINIED